MKITTPVYWGSTGLLSIIMCYTGVSMVLLDSRLLDDYQHLAYPMYFYRMLGFAKLIGIIVLLWPFVGRLKEWAYAGFAINIIAALWSHIAAGSELGMVFSPVLAGALYLVSYLSYRRHAAFVQKNQKNTIEIAMAT